MSAPRKITAWGTGRKLSLLGGSPEFQHLYHHDDVVRELVEALREIAETDPPSEIWDGPYGIRAIRMRAAAALAKIAQEVEK